MKRRHSFTQSYRVARSRQDFRVAPLGRSTLTQRFPSEGPGRLIQPVASQQNTAARAESLQRSGVGYAVAAGALEPFEGGPGAACGFHSVAKVAAFVSAGQGAGVLWAVAFRIAELETVASPARGTYIRRER